MESMMSAKLIALGVLLMAMTAFAVACGGDTLEFTELTPIPDPTATVAPTTAPGSVITTPIAVPTSEPATQAIPPTPEPATQVIPPTTETAAPTEPPEDVPIELRLMIMKRDSNDLVTVLEEGGVLTGNDFYGIFFEPDADSWVYILQQDSTSAIDVLFPNPDFSDQTNPVAGGTPVWIPKDISNWFVLDQNIGRESFFVVASKEQPLELESIIAGHEREEVLGPLAGFLQSGARGLGGSKTLDKEPKILPDGNTLELGEQLLQGEGDNFVYSLGFQHE